MTNATGVHVWGFGGLHVAHQTAQSYSERVPYTRLVMVRGAGGRREKTIRSWGASYSARELHRETANTQSSAPCYLLVRACFCDERRRGALRASGFTARLAATIYTTSHASTATAKSSSGFRAGEERQGFARAGVPSARKETVSYGWHIPDCAELREAGRFSALLQRRALGVGRNSGNACGLEGYGAGRGGCG